MHGGPQGGRHEDCEGRMAISREKNRPKSYPKSVFSALSTVLKGVLKTTRTNPQEVLKKLALRKTYEGAFRAISRADGGGTTHANASGER
jgi:hypothetical protein